MIDSKEMTDNNSSAYPDYKVPGSQLHMMLQFDDYRPGESMYGIDARRCLHAALADMSHMSPAQKREPTSRRIFEWTVEERARIMVLPYWQWPDLTFDLIEQMIEGYWSWVGDRSGLMTPTVSVWIESDGRRLVCAHMMLMYLKHQSRDT